MYKILIFTVFKAWFLWLFFVLRQLWPALCKALRNLKKKINNFDTNFIYNMF